ncbi:MULTISPECIES: hypothetical protein [unclassified Moorena]|nr:MULTISPECIES: hypothetical protein [unclassified Moorena]NEQ06520.1 hypothetical protein [Moorena sp. SIO4E2]NEQ13601.1 hypothetical protein [Moorena sp. SIO3E2]NES40391.1 hypothetical protein [Moorena sp. SIO2C4]
MRYAHATGTAISYQLSVISYQLSAYALRQQLLNKTGNYLFNLSYVC